MRARLWERIYNKRHDFLHKVSTSYSKQYDRIFLERLQTANMVKNRRLSRHILDSGWMELFQKYAGIQAENRYRGQSCLYFCCLFKVWQQSAKNFGSTYAYRCDKYGLVLDRDHNAELNILQRGRAMLCLPPQLQQLQLPMVHGEVTPLENLLCGSMKEEEAHEFIRG